MSQLKTRKPRTFTITCYNPLINKTNWQIEVEPYNYFLVTEQLFIHVNKKNGGVIAVNLNSGKIVWSLKNIKEEALGSTDFKLNDWPIQHNNSIFINLLHNNSVPKKELYCIDSENGKIKWSRDKYDATGFWGNECYLLSYEGMLTVLNIKSGVKLRSANLKKSFNVLNIGALQRLYITEEHIYFKNSSEGTIGVVDRKNLFLIDNFRIPHKETISEEETPLFYENRLYIHSSRQNNLFIYENNPRHTL